MSGNYGRGGDGHVAARGNDPQWDDSVWQQDQPSRRQPGYDQQQPYGQQPRDGQQPYDGRGYGGQDYDQGQGYPQAYPGQGYGGQTREQPGYDGRNYGQPDPRTRTGLPASRGRAPARSSTRAPARRGTGGQQLQRGSGSMQQVPPGYDPPRHRPAPPARQCRRRRVPVRRLPAARPTPADGQRDDSFLPGFGPRDDFEGGPGQYDGRRDPRRGGRRAAPATDAADGRGADGRAADPRSAEFAQQDLRTRGDRRRARDDDRDPRDPRSQAGPPRPARRGRDDWDGNGGDGGTGGYDDDGPATQAARPRPPPRAVDRAAGDRRAAGLGGLHVYGIYQAKVHPADYTGAGTAPTVTVQVTSGETRQQARPDAAERRRGREHPRVRASGRRTAPTPYRPRARLLRCSSTHMQASLAWAALLNPKNRDQTMVTIPEGKRASQVIAIVAKHTKIPLKDFQTGRSPTRPSSACRPTRTARSRATCSRPPTRSSRTRPRCRSCRRW